VTKTTKKHRPPNVPSERPGPEGGKRDANRREKVRLLCDVSLGLFCDGGVEAVTIDEVVAKANVAKGSFYRYFSGKEELVETLFSPLAEEMRSLSEATQDALRATTSSVELSQAYLDLATTVARLLASNLEILRLYLQENRGPAVGARRPIINLAKEIDQIAFDLTEVARSQGLLRSDYDLKVGSLTSLGAAERLLFSYVRGDNLGSPAMVSAELIQVILNGVRA